MNSYEDCIAFLLAKAYQKALSVIKRRLAGYGLTAVQQLIVVAVAEHEGRPAGELGRRVGLDNATLSGTLDRLVNKDWIEKRPDPDDGRVVLVSLSQAAREQIPALVQERRMANEEILSDFSNEEVITLRRLLRDFQEPHVLT